MINDISEGEGMNLPEAKFQFGQKVKINWHKADGDTSEAWIVGVNYNPYLSGNIYYEALVEPVAYIITDVDEDMLEAIEEAKAEHERLVGVCEWELQENDVFSRSCGSPIMVTVPTPYCPHCGKNVKWR